jgi:hypothetical protein
VSSTLPSPTGWPRGNERSDLSPREDLAVGILPHLEEDFFQDLADQIIARGGAKASDGGPRRAICCRDPAAQPGQAGFRG